MCTSLLWRRLSRRSMSCLIIRAVYSLIHRVPYLDIECYGTSVLRRNGRILVLLYPDTLLIGEHTQTYALKCHFFFLFLPLLTRVDRCAVRGTPYSPGA